MTPELLVTLVFVPMGLIVMTSGILVYNGKFRAYRAMLSLSAPGEPALASAYLGVCLILMPMAGFFPDTESTHSMSTANGLLTFVVGVIYFKYMFATFVVGVFGAMWMPRFLQPQWIRDERDKGKAEARARREMKRKRKLYQE